MASTRRLAAIFAADVAGYSRLMGADEEGTHERLKRHWRELVEPKIKEYQGQIVKNTDDGRVWYWQIGLVHLLQARTDDAIIWLEKARNATLEHTSVRAALASAYALNGETERAAAELAEARRLSPDDRYSSIARVKAAGRYYGVPKIRALFEATYIAGLRKAGMPDE
jgi:class 3 adenylate cyclase